MFSGDDYPRIWSGEDARRAPNIDVSRINRPPGGHAGPPARGYLAGLRVSIPTYQETTEKDVHDIRQFGSPHFNPDEKVSMRFDKASIDFFVKQMLGGALGLNYVLPDNLEGTITFRTEEPLPKGQVLQVVRDILARQGLVMKNMNGVYQIDRADVVSATEAASRAGRDGDQMTRLIKVPRGNAAEISAIVRQLVPEDVTLVAPSRSELIVKATTQGDLNSVADLVSSLAKGAVGDDSVAIIPLTQASPGRIAAQLSEFYKARLGSNGADSVTIIPLETQNAILVGTRDPTIMAGVRRLTAQLDRNSLDEMTVRIIPLTNLNAEDTAQRLSAILNNNGGGGGGTSGRLSSGRTAGALAGNGAGAGEFGSTGAGQLASSSAAIQPPVAGSWPYGGLQGTQPASAQAGDASPAGGARPIRASLTQGGERGPAAPDVGMLGSAGGVRFEPDTRNNALMVYSNYAVFKKVQEVVRTLDVPQAQVVIEATIAEVTLTDDLQFGVQAFLAGKGFTARNSTSATATDSGANGTFANVGFSIGSVKANLILQALQSVTTVKVISSPYLTVLDKKTARLVVGDQIPFAQSTQTSNNAGTTTITENIQTKDTGVVLEVTPRINANNSVALNVDQQITTPASSAYQGDKTPVIATREVKSDILVQSGRTFVLGGLIQERLDKTELGTPGLRSVPVLGDLFKPQQDNKATRVELLVMITPRVVRQSTDLERITRLLRDQLHVR